MLISKTVKINQTEDRMESVSCGECKGNKNHKILVSAEGIGIRTILEAITQEQNTPGIDLREKIDNLVKKGVITQKDVGALHDLRQIGNESTHAIAPSSPKEMKVAMDVIEHLLEGIYILPHRVKENLSSPLKNKPNTIQ